MDTVYPARERSHIHVCPEHLVRRGVVADLLTAAERIDAVSERADEAESRAAEAEKNATYLAADMARITDHHLAVIRGVAAGTVPPWPPVPR